MNIIKKGTRFQPSTLGHNSIHYPLEIYPLVLKEDIEAEPQAWWSSNGMVAYAISTEIAQRYHLNYKVIWI